MLSARQTESTSAKVTLNANNPFKNSQMARTSYNKGAAAQDQAVLEASLFPDGQRRNQAQDATQNESDPSKGPDKLAMAKPGIGRVGQTMARYANQKTVPTT